MGLASPWEVSGQAFVVGYNQAWIGRDYGTDLTSNFKPDLIEKTFGQIAQAGGSVVRIWLFEDKHKEGLLYGSEGGKPTTEVVGLVPGFLDQLERLIQIAQAKGLKVYFTLLSGNWWLEERDTHASYVHYNILNNKYGRGDQFNEKAVAPVLEVFNRHRGAVFALDLMNEVEGSVYYMWEGGWEGARRWLERTASFVKERSPWLKVTASAGHPTGPLDLMGGRFDGLGLDFYDLHVYSDRGEILGLETLCRFQRARGLPLVLGEFGQRSKQADDELHARVTAGFLRQAKASCFSAALPWRFDDGAGEHSYLGAEGPRPAVREVLRFVQEHPPAWPW